MEQAIYSLYLNVSNLWSSVLCGSPNERQSKIYEFMKNVNVGDFVMENSSGWVATRAWEEGRKEDAITHIKAMFGVLEEITKEEISGFDDEERKELVKRGESVPTETVYYIRNLHGVRFRWHNASFLNVPKEFKEAR